MKVHDKIKEEPVGNGENVESVMTNIIDMNTFTSKIVEERKIKKQKLIL